MQTRASGRCPLTCIATPQVLRSRCSPSHDPRGTATKRRPKGKDNVYQDMRGVAASRPCPAGPLKRIQGGVLGHGEAYRTSHRLSTSLPCASCYQPQPHCFSSSSLLATCPTMKGTSPRRG